MTNIVKEREKQKLKSNDGCRYKAYTKLNTR